LNRSTFALFVALLIHIVILLLFWLLGTLSPELIKQKKEEKKLKISLKELPKKYKKSGLTKEKIPQSKVAPPMPKGSQLEKITENTPLKYTPTKPPKEPVLNKPKQKIEKPKPKPKVQALPPKKPYIPLLAKQEDINLTKKEKVEDNPLAWLSEDRSQQEVKKKNTNTMAGSNISSDVKELYG